LIDENGQCGNGVEVNPSLKPSDAHCCHMGTAMKHPMPDWVKSSFEFLTYGHSDAQPWASECPDVKHYKCQLNLVCHCVIAVPIWQQWALEG